MDWTVSDIQAATQGHLVCGNPALRFSEIGIDSRTLASGAFFVAIAGQTHDGHQFAESVIQRGCRGVLLQANQVNRMPIEAWQAAQVVCISVADTTQALGDLAAYHRKRAGVGVVAITGSNGKTSTREMTAFVVAEKFNTLTTMKNFNNEIGLPLTLFRLTAGHEWVVAELGMNHPGEIRRLGAICRPNIGVITNIGPAHLENLGSLNGVMAAKGELLEAIEPKGTAVLNADDPRCLKLADHVSHEVLLFGLSEAAHIRAVNLREKGRATAFTLQLPEAKLNVELNAPGRFMVSNALAAAAVGVRLGISPEGIKSGLERFKAVSGRATVLDTAAGIYVIDDTYNANPGSMAAAIAMLATLGKGARCFLAVGDMLELGPQAAALHREIGEQAARAGLYRIGATGQFATDLADGALAGGMAPAGIVVGTRQELLADFKQQLTSGDWVLVKGSRSMAMESISNDLVAWAGGPATPKPTAG
jgi:UDP-N-acetylmuramoyl-tripeptide--D-alanyl-D-alanine ligase